MTNGKKVLTRTSGGTIVSSMETEKKGYQRSTQAQENPIQLHAYSRKPGFGHKDAVRLLNSMIRESSGGDWVSGPHMKVGV